GQDHHVAPAQVMILVPQVDRFFTESVHHGVVDVVIPVGAGESDDSRFHNVLTLAISKSSITGFARSLVHMARVERSAAELSNASISTTRWRPTWTSCTAANPKVRKASVTALP